MISDIGERNVAELSNDTTRDDTMGTQTKSGPAGASTPVIPGLTATKERLMTQRIKTPPTGTPQATARLFLELAADDLKRAKRTRDYYVTLAHKYEMSNVEIGVALGVSEGRIRQILAGA